MRCTEQADLSQRRGTRLGWCVVAILVIAVLPSLSIAQAVESEAGIDWAKAREFWSFRPPAARKRPAVKHPDWGRQPLDFFVLQRIEQKGLLPSPDADKRILVRRVAFDLTGLPPTPRQVQAFLVDDRPDAYERLVDRLLASPTFGQRMASLWLPLARYAEDQAHQVGNDTQFFYPNAYKYRQWVIDAFNRDLPYDRFITLQLAADKLDDGDDDLAALGFIGLGPKYYNRNRLDVQADEWEDRVDTVTRTFLALTVGCARCHDHKYDPITQRDYYALAGIFASTRLVNKTSDGIVVDGKTSADKMPADTLHIVEDGPAQDLNVFIRGDVERKGDAVPRRFLQVLCDGVPQEFHDGSGRKELAQAIANRNNPLTARVMVNRVWAMLLGRSIVATPSNFGHSGMLPSHPELLDDLAVRFMEGGWSIKSLVRQIVLSSTYRQSSQMDGASAAADPANELYWRMNRRRLTVEQWRDAVLLVCGELDSEGGKSMELDDPKNFRRTVFARVSRLKLNDLLTQFDYPDANVHAEKRAVTTTALQKLFVLNSPFILQRSKALAARLTLDSKESDVSRVGRAYRLLFGREPERNEVDLALGFLKKPTTAPMSRWEQYAQMLLVCDEMLYVD